MLKSFSVKNYKNFKDEITLDFSKYNDYQFNKSIIHNGLISKSIIIGKNGSGKTNFGLAIFDLTLHLIDRQQIMQQLQYYLNASSTEDFASFSYEFVFDNDVVLYKYRKNNPKSLLYEELYLNNNLIFSFNFITNKRDIKNLSLIGAENLNFSFKDSGISILRYIANNANLPKTSVIMKLMNFVGSMLWFRSAQENSYIGYKIGIDFLLEHIINNALVGKFESFLNESDLDVKLEVISDPTGAKKIVSRFENRVIPFIETASSGTLALTLFFYWSTRFDDISFLFIDEFDAFYHFELSEAILKNVVKRHNIQAIFTSHNTALITNNILRPDCYYIMENGQLKSITNSTEKTIREGHNLEKMYRSGEFND